MNLYCLFICFEKVTQHAFICDSHFSTKEKSKCCGAIIDKRSCAPICVLEVKDRKIKGALKNMISKLFDGNCILEIAFKVTAYDSSKHIMNLYLLLY